MIVHEGSALRVSPPTNLFIRRFDMISVSTSRIGKNVKLFNSHLIKSATSFNELLDDSEMFSIVYARISYGSPKIGSNLNYYSTFPLN